MTNEQQIAREERRKSASRVIASYLRCQTAIELLVKDPELCMSLLLDLDHLHRLWIDYYEQQRLLGFPDVDPKLMSLEYLGHKIFQDIEKCDGRAKVIAELQQNTAKPPGDYSQFTGREEQA